MALNENSPLSERAVYGGQLVDIAGASTSYAPVPFAGVVVDAYSTISAAITTGNNTITVKKLSGGVSSTIGTITITQVGSAPGDTDRMVITGTEGVCSVVPGDTLSFTTDGSSDTTCIANFTAVVRGG